MGKILFTSSSFKQRKVFPSLLQESFQTVLFSILTLERERNVLLTILKFCEDGKGGREGVRREGGSEEGKRSNKLLFKDALAQGQNLVSFA